MGSTREFSLPIRLFLKAYPWRRIQPIPWVPLSKPLSQCRVALATSAGFSAAGQPPFDDQVRGGDATFRLLSADTEVATLQENHRSTVFDRSGLHRDRNLAFPLDRLREMAAAGRIGSVAPQHLSFMGSQTAPGRLIRDTAPVAAARLRADGVDAAVLIPVCPVCNQTVALIAAELERQGIATVCLMLLREVAEKVRPPRALCVPFRHGYPLGQPDDPDGQARVLEAAFYVLEHENGPAPVLRELKSGYPPPPETSPDGGKPQSTTPLIPKVPSAGRTQGETGPTPR
ncbi:MAG: hypothetical protein JNK85_18840 [Verrucomicrobiales bacterium]|nr:hypothetical protein [Verrucomicrobiales bacterium]